MKRRRFQFKPENRDALCANGCGQETYEPDDAIVRRLIRAII
jgi:hypothetical protein